MHKKIKKILVTGNYGFIGSKLTAALRAMGHEVTEFDRVLGSRIEELPDVDLVYHLAAQTDVQWSLEHYREDMEDNLTLLGEIIHRYPKTRIVYPASASSMDIQSPYGLSKKTACDYLRLLHPDTVIVMFPNIYGPGGKGVIDVWRKQEVLTIRGTGEQTRTIVHVDDVVCALVLAGDWPRGDYSLGGQVLSLNQIAEKIGKPVKYDEGFKGEVFSSVIETNAPGWEPRITL